MSKRTPTALIRWLTGCAALLFLQAWGLSFAADNSSVRIGVLNSTTPQQTLETWTATADYLSEHISGYTFEIIPLNFDEISTRVSKREIEFLLTNPFNYSLLEQSHGISALLTLERQHTPYFSSSRYAATIFVRSERDDIQTIEDLRGKSFVAVHEKSLGGWLMALRQFKRVDIFPRQDFKQLDFAYDPHAVVKAVLSGVVDAGTVRSGVIEQMVLHNQLRGDALRVLPPNQESLDDPNTPVLHSTDFYSEWPLAQLNHTPAQLSAAISVALLTMPAQHPALVSAGLAAWQTPQQYQTIHELMEDLELTDYHQHSDITIEELTQQHGQTLLLLAITLLVLTSASIWFAHLWRREQAHSKQLNTALTDSERHGTQLQQLNTYTNAVLNSITEAYFCVDKNWQINDHNSQALTLLTEGEPILKGKILWSIFTELERGEFHESFTLGTSREFTLYFPATDRWLEFHTFPATMEMKIYFRDVSQRERANITLEEKENQLNAILLHMLDAVIAIDEKGHILNFNHAAETMFGYQESDVIGKTISVLMPTPHADQHQDYIHHYLKSGLTRTIGVGRELIGKRRNGELFTMEITVSDIQVKDKHIFLGICRDISQRKQYELELQRLATAVAETTDSIFITDNDGLLEYVNPSYIKTTGVAHPLGKRHRLFDNDATLLGKNWHNIINGRQYWSGQYPCTRHNGTEYIEETSLTPVLDKRGRVQCFVGVSRDISQALAQQGCQPGPNNNRILTALNNGISHEIDRLIKNADEHLAFAQNSIDNRSPEARHINQATGAIQRARVLAERLTAFSQPQLNQTQVIEPLAVISDTVHLIRTIYAPRVNIEFQHDTALPNISIAPNAFQQMLMASAMCAAKASHNGSGTVTVNAKRQHITDDEQKGEVAAGDYLMIQVKDNSGQLNGLSSEQVVDAPFAEQLAQSQRPGLATVFALCSEANGVMTLLNTAGDGLLLSVYLPALSAASEP